MALLGESIASLDRATRATQKSDYLIVNRRREEENRNKMVERTNYYASTALKSTFEETSTNAIRRNHLFRRLEELKSVESAKLEDRRQRLKELLQRDEERYSEELLNMEETQGSRLERMKARMEELRSRRESERQKVVEDKLLQRWRNQCDELRTIESKMLERDVAAQRADQLLEAEERKARNLEEKKYFDKLWEQDRLQKIAKEEAEKNRQREMNAATTSILEAQLLLLRKQEKEEERLKQEEAKLMRQEMEMRELEDERRRQRKLAEQRIIRLELDKFNKIKVEQRAKEVRESLELDMKIVNEFFRMDQSEAEIKSRKRAELRKEMQLYREHLLEQQKIEREREKEIDRLQREENDKLWRNRSEKWRKEQLARDTLMQEVLDGRKEQLKNAVNQNQLRLLEIQQERENVLRQIEAAQRVEEADRIHKEATMDQYRQALAAQMESSEEKRREERRKIEREGEAFRVADQRYRELLSAELDRTLHNNK
ncbi:Cilia- and flagella-associated protein 53 [Phlyctochytrium planicorne]|nr:Cilia- and flagella-associated protein 53 [Phlyctochytrium planicorne]